MAQGSQTLTTYYAKRIIGDNAAASPDKALLQTGIGIESDAWILNQTKRYNNNTSQIYGIKYIYDGTNDNDTIEFYGNKKKNNVLKPSVTIYLNSGNTEIDGTLDVASTVALANTLEVTGATTLSSTLEIGSTSLFKDNVTIETSTSPTLTLESTASSAVDWDIKNDQGIFIIIDKAGSSNKKLIGDHSKGWEIHNKLYINTAIPDSGTLHNLQVNGSSYFDGSATHTGYVYFADGTTYYIDNSGNANLHAITANATVRLNVAKDSGYIYVRGNTNTKDMGYFGLIRSTTDEGDLYYNTKFRVLYYSYDSTTKARLDTYEVYNLPTVDEDLTEDKSYSILTTKNTVTTAQGGTGVTSHTANRLVWSTSATTIQAGYHYASTTKVGICYTSEPSYNFAVSGTSYFSNTITSAGNIYISNTSPHIFLQNTNWTKGTTPSANYYSALEFHTSGDYASNKRVGILEVNIDTSNNVWMNIWTIPNAAYSTSWTGIRLKRASDGALTIYNAGDTEITGCLSIFPNQNSYREGIRVHSTGSWSDITLCGNDNTGNSGTSANSWFLGNNNGNFYIARNGSPGSTAYLACVSNIWKIYGNQSNSKSKQQSILHIYGPTYGNTAADMISGTAGLFSWGDGGPQITFDTSATPGDGQAGALIFTDHDTAGAGVSWHFVSNQSDWVVTSKRFKALTDFNGPLVHTASGVSYIAGAKGTNATVYAKKATGAVWRPAVCLQTSGGGAWQIGNYNDETLEFQYATAANISSQTNSTSEIYMQNGDTGRVITTGNYTNWCATSGHNHDSTYLKLSGGTLTGNVIMSTASGDHYFEVKSTATGVRLELDNSGSTNHGLWSSGYWNGSAYTASSSWMIYRNASGTNIVNGNCTGSSGSCTGNAATATTASNLASSSASFTVGGASGGGSVKKYGQLVLCVIQCQTTSQCNANAVLGTIPSGYRPSYAHWYQGYYASTLIHVGVYTDGTIKPNATIPSGAPLRMDFVYSV